MADKIKFDKRNYRKHNDRNKKLINKSLKECGAGRSIVIDKDNEIIAGNGIYEQAQKLGIKTKIIETDGSELVVVKRTDLASDDEKRKRLAVMDNTTSDSSEFNIELLEEDFGKDLLNDMGFDVNIEPENVQLEYEKPYTPTEEQTITDIIEHLPEELKDTKLMPEQFQEIVTSFKPMRERVIITFPEERKQEIAEILGLESLDKVVYTLEEITGEEE